LLIIDEREPGQFAQQHLKGALNLHPSLFKVQGYWLH